MAHFGYDNALVTLWNLPFQTLV